MNERDAMSDSALVKTLKIALVAFTVFFLITFLAGCASLGNKNPAPSSYKITMGQGHCTSVKTSGGVFVTAAHCIAAIPEGDAAKLVTDGKETPIEVLWVSKDYDLAVFIAEGTEALPHSPLRCSAPVIGEDIVAVGNPYDLQGIHNYGRVSGHPGKLGPWADAWAGNISFFQGMSGGPVYDSRGSVVGIITGFRVALIAGFVGATYSWSDIGLFVPAYQVCKMMGKHD